MRVKCFAEEHNTMIQSRPYNLQSDVMSNIDLAVSCTKWPTQPAGAYPCFYSMKQQEELLPLPPFPLEGMVVF